MKASKILVFLLVILLGGVGFFAYNYYTETKRLEIELASKEKQIIQLQKTVKEKNKTIVNLQSLLKEKENELETVRKELGKEKSLVSYLQARVEELLSSIESTNNLERRRTEFIESNLQVNFSQYFNNELSLCTNNSTFNYPCFAVLLENANFSYRKERGDYLEGVKEFIRNKGGDCEDWAFFTYSLLHYLQRNGIKEVILFNEANGSKLFLYKQNRTLYYLPNAKPIGVNLTEYSYITMICYKINETLGHCVNALCRKPLTPGKENDCIVFEPQNGEYLGNLSDYINKLEVILSGDFFFKRWQIWK